MLALDLRGLYRQQMTDRATYATTDRQGNRGRTRAGRDRVTLVMYEKWHMGYGTHMTTKTTSTSHGHVKIIILLLCV